MAHATHFTLPMRGTKSVWVGTKEKGRRVLLRHDKPMQLSTDEVKLLTAQGIELAPYTGPELTDQYAPTPAMNKAPIIPEPDPVDLSGQYAAVPSDKDAKDVDWDEVVGDANAPDVVEIINGLDSIDEVKAVMAAEKKGKDRVTVMDAGKSRIATLKGE